MSELEYSLLDQQFDFASMDVPDFSSLDEQLFNFEAQPMAQSLGIERFMVGDAASMLQTAGWERPISQTEAEFLANIDPSLLPTCDAPLDAFTPLPSLEVTEASMFDPSPGVDWQPMENIETSIDPTLLSPFDMHLDPFAVPGPPFHNDVIFPPHLIESCTSSTDSPPEVPPTFRNPFDDSANDRQSKKQLSTTLHHPASRSTPAWNKTNQPRVNGTGCPCDLCKGGAVNFSALNNQVEKRSKSGRVTKSKGNNTSNKSGRVTKRKAKKFTAQRDGEDSDSSHSSIPDLDVSESEPEYKPRPTARTRRAAAAAAALRRGRKLGKMAAMKNLPKELNINMEKWW